MLSKIWAGLILFGILGGIVQAFGYGNDAIFSQMVTALFESAQTAFEISIGLTGMMALWLGLLKIGEAAGFISGLARFLSPLFRRVFPEIPKDHPALGNMTMNIAANMLGLDNAATPLGLKAMQSLQELNPTPDRASNAQILFLVLNTASVTIFPLSVFVFRTQMGALDPTDVFVPILLTTYVGTICAFLMVAWIQKLRIFDWVVLLYIGSFTAIIAAMTLWFLHLSPEDMQKQSALLSHCAILSVIAIIVGAGLLKKIDIFSEFIEGAKDGFTTAVKIIPYLVAMLAAISIFRSSGMLELLMGGLRNLVALTGYDVRWIDGLPTALMKTLSGSGARAMMVDVMKVDGPDSFAGHLVSVIQGSTETTFYVLAVYFGSVGIRNMRYALACGLFADLVGFIAAVVMTYWFFG